MSTSLASAKKRRANVSEPTPQFQNRQQIQPGMGMTLQQVIKLIDTRLLTLEKNVLENNNNPEDEEGSNEWVDEFNKRTEIIATEIDTIKSSLLQLQTFTMEVNKKLFDMVMAQTTSLHLPAPVSVPVSAPVSVPVSAPVSAPAPVPDVVPAVATESAPVENVTPIPTPTVSETVSTQTTNKKGK